MDMKQLTRRLRDRFAEEAKRTYGREGRVRFLGEETGTPAERCLKWKTIDEVNYVHRTSVTLSRDGNRVLSLGCSCGQSLGCLHLAAALLYGVPDGYVFDAGEPETREASDIDMEQELRELPETETIPIEQELPQEIEVCEPEAQEQEIPVEKEELLTEKSPEPHEEEKSFLWDGEIREMKILLGRNLETGEDVYWNPNDTNQVFHTNTGIIGTMGTGKTQFTKSLVTQLYREQLAHKNFDGRPYHVLIFDYKGDYNESKPDFVEAVNARVYKPYRLAYNPFSLVQSDSFRPLLPVHTANTFKDTLTKSFRLGPKQQQLLLDCILAAYGRCGILAEDPSTWDRRAPTFEQVYEIFVEKTENKVADSLAAAMNKLYQFRIFSPDPHKTISITDFVQGVTVLDLSGYDSDIQSFVVAITLDQFYAQMLKAGSSKTNGRYRQLNTLILVDEADNFMKEDFTSLRKIMKEGREFGVGMVLSTQSLNHFLGGEDDYSRYILTWVVHNVSDLSQREVEYIYKLQPKAQEIPELYGSIKGLAKHESILKIANSQPRKIRDKAFFELDLSPEKEPNNSFVTRNASGNISAETIQSWYREKPSHGTDALIGMDDLIAWFEDEVEGGLFAGEKGREFGNESILLYGPKGSGLTYAANALIHDLMTKYNKISLIHLNASDIFSAIVGVAEHTISTAFQEAVDNAPSILFLENLDQICYSRELNCEGMRRRLTDCFLEGLSNIQNGDAPVLLIATSNAPWLIDSCAARKIRCQFHISAPSRETRRSYMQAKLDRIAFHEDLSLEYMADDTKNFVFGGLNRLCRDLITELKNKALATICEESCSYEEQEIRLIMAVQRGEVKLDKALYETVRARRSATVTQEELEKFGQYNSLRAL